MSIKDILVHVESGARCTARLGLAIALAKRMGARITGLFAQQDAHLPSLVTRQGSQYLMQAAAEAKDSFVARMESAGLKWRWLQLEMGNPDFIISETIICARYADLVILGQHDRDARPARVPSDLAEQVILNAGRPVLVLPFAGDFQSCGSRVAVAWNGGRESTRALHDSMPFLTSAQEVTLLAVHGERPESSVPVPQVDVVDHLSAHGVAAKMERVTPSEMGIMDTLLSRSFDLAADLLVMGAHGQYGFPYLHRGAGTRFVLQHQTIPVLFSH